MLNNLYFRRQFILGSDYISTFEDWNKLKISEKLYLSSQKDLEVTHVNLKDRSLTLIGFIIDPFRPNDSNFDIVKRIIESSNCFEDILSNSYPYSGRWVMVYNSDSESKVFHDPCGMRQVYYLRDYDNIWCASQPSLLNNVFNVELNNNESIREYIESDAFKKNENAWFGDETIYREIKKLLPNRYLDLETNDVKRFWQDEEIYSDVDTISKNASKILEGSIQAISNRHKLMLAVTAGWDSRVLLAASKNFKNNIFYYVSTMNILKQNHMDIRIPKRLARKLDIDITIADNLKPLTKELNKMIKRNVTFGRTELPKSLTIQYHFENNQDKINIGGNASEIMRMFYGDDHPEDLDGRYLAEKVGLSSYKYIINTLDDWVQDARELDNKIDIMDLFYWEQRMGNWGTLYQAEQDIAIEEFCPFNNRKLIMLMLKADKKYRSAPKYILYNKIIENLWDEVLTEPINPLTIKGKVRSILVSVIPKGLKLKIKKLIT